MEGIRSNGNGQLVIDKKTLMPLSLIFLVLSVAIGVTSSWVTLYNRVNFQSQEISEMSVKIDTILDKVINIDKRLTILEMQQRSLQSADLEAITEKDIVSFKKPYENLNVTYMWVELGGASSG